MFSDVINCLISGIVSFLILELRVFGNNKKVFWFFLFMILIFIILMINIIIFVCILLLLCGFICVNNEYVFYL